MWLPAVLGEITSRSAISLFDSPRASSLRTSTSRGGQARRSFAAPRHAVAGGAEHRLDGFGVEATGLDIGPQLGGGLVGRARAAGRDAARASPGRRRRRRGSAPGGEIAGAGEPARVARSVEALAVLHRDRAERRERLGLVEHALGQVRVHAHALPLARRRAARACPRSRSRCRAARSRARARRGAACAARRPARPSCAPAAAARSATARACPSVYGDFRSTKFAIARSAASNCSPESTTASAGSASITASQVPTASRSAEKHRSASAQTSAASAGSNCLPAALAGERLARLDAADAVRDLDELARAARAARRAGSPRPRARPASRARPTARRPRRARRAPRRAARAARARVRAIAAWWAIMSSTSRCPESANSSPTRKRCSGGLPAPMTPHRRRGCRAGSCGSWSYLTDFSAMSSPNHLACSCASVWQPTLIEQRGVVDDRALAPRRARCARPAAARSGTAAARAPSAARSRGRCRARARRRAPPAGPARGRSRWPRGEANPAGGTRQELRVLGGLAPSSQLPGRGRGRPAR